MILGLTACTSVSVRNDQFARAQGWAVEKVSGREFDHRVYRSLGNHSDFLHVYLEGDGRPWIGRSRVNLRPETAKPLMLRLMAMDPNPAAYVVRPCYNENVADTNCHPWYWTQGRYSETVVESMAQAIEQLVSEHPGQRVRLYGHSGGGTLAMLLASRLSDVDQVVTLAANLDIDAWTQHHGFSPLKGSLNPVASGDASGVLQTHYLGAKDHNVTTQMFPFPDHPPLREVVVLPDTEHLCCWERHWAEILNTSVKKSNENMH